MDSSGSVNLRRSLTIADSVLRPSRAAALCCADPSPHRHLSLSIIDIIDNR